MASPTSVKVGNPTPKAASAAKTSNGPSASTNTPWKTLLGLTLIFVELWLNTGIIWGIFSLLWAIIGIQSGQTYILEILDRKVHPILFWITIHLWLMFAAFFFMSNSVVYGYCEALIRQMADLIS